MVPWVTIKLHTSGGNKLQFFNPRASPSGFGIAIYCHAPPLVCNFIATLGTIEQCPIASRLAITQYYISFWHSNTENNNFVFIYLILINTFLNITKTFS